MFMSQVKDYLICVPFVPKKGKRGKKIFREGAKAKRDRFD
jgi:hypothetical protein